jgi:uncharacterized membrane protein YphA (DoxX/SURF4 family)
MTLNRGAFMKPLLPWKNNKYYIFLYLCAWVSACGCVCVCLGERARACAFAHVALLI